MSINRKTNWHEFLDVHTPVELQVEVKYKFAYASTLQVQTNVHMPTHINNRIYDMKLAIYLHLSIYRYVLVSFSLCIDVYVCMPVYG